MNNDFTPREQIIEVANKLFVYTDNRQWQRLREEVFTHTVLFDMASVGAGDAIEKSALEICDNWEKGFEGIDAIHHQAGNYLVKINDDTASVHAYAIAIHYKRSATKGNTREFVGSYELGFIKNVVREWRINMFRYYLKYTQGNVELL